MSMDLDYADGWRPNPGDVLVGEVTNVDVGYGNYGDTYPIVTVKPSTGDAVAVHCFHAALKSRVMDLRPVVGETVGFQFKGKEQHPKDANKTINRYAFKVKGRTGEDAYARLAGQRQPPQPQQQEAFQPQQQPPAGAMDQAPASQADDDIPF